MPTSATGAPPTHTIQQHRLTGNVTLGGIGDITGDAIATFETLLKNYTTNYYLNQTDGVVTSVSVNVTVTNTTAATTTTAAATSGGTWVVIYFNESISYCTTNATLNSTQVAFRPIQQNSTAFLYAIQASGGIFGQVTTFSANLVGVPEAMPGMPTAMPTSPTPAPQFTPTNIPTPMPTSAMVSDAANTEDSAVFTLGGLHTTWSMISVLLMSIGYLLL
jgi:hypothetical protein